MDNAKEGHRLDVMGYCRREVKSALEGISLDYNSGFST